MFPIIYYVTILFIVNLKQFEAKYGDECLTPNYSLGQCVPIRSCSNILNSLIDINDVNDVPEEVANFLRQSACGEFNGVHHVCCAKENITLNIRGLEILNKTACGHLPMPRMAHGEEARLFTLPWMVLLKYDGSPPFRCGATLISRRYVLTAAQCVHSYEYSPNEVRLGEHNIISALDCQRYGRRERCIPPVEEIGIDEIIVHPNHYRARHDIALIRLNRTVDFKEHIGAICLPISDDLRTTFPEEYFASGWGFAKNHTFSYVPRIAIVPHQNLSECSNTYSRANLTPNHICAGGEERVDFCRGVSGNPISYMGVYNGRVKLIQYGIKSHGMPSCGNYPDVYTNVASYMQWITDTIRDD